MASKDRVLYAPLDTQEENRYLRESVEHLERELERYRRAPLIACEIKELFEEKALIRLSNGNEFLVDVSLDLQLRPGDSVLAEQKNLTVVQKIPSIKRFDVERYVIMDKPDISWSQIGGLGYQEMQLKEVIELPLTKPELFRKIGIHPPKGVLLHGPPGTGKTMLAKAVASSTKSTFIEVVGSELVQKYIGEGAKLVKEIFALARERAPSIIFIDELDAIAAKRMDIGTSGEREVQRTFMQLLAEIDGFKPLDNVKVIGCTNRKDILDPAILRPGRLDRLIDVPLPDEVAKRDIFKIHTKRMKTQRFRVEALVKSMEGMSGADIKSVATEAGYSAIRNNRQVVSESDFWHGISRVKKVEDKEFLSMFG